MKPVRPAEEPAQLFKDQSGWTTWLRRHHRNASGIWLRLAKKGSGLHSVSYSEALESALCYGWIDSQKKPENDKTWLQRFVPRSDKSIWSKINREKAEALTKNGRMTAAGQEAIERARANGRWTAAYDSPSRSTVPEDFQAALDVNARANSFFQTLDRANRYAILFRIQTVKKAETRERKIKEFIAMLEQNEKIHP
jgi:uncharacterized protein YdeI (YjbR/CyaY-like superfamily)